MPLAVNDRTDQALQALEYDLFLQYDLAPQLSRVAEIRKGKAAEVRLHYQRDFVPCLGDGLLDRIQDQRRLVDLPEQRALGRPEAEVPEFGSL